MIISILNEALRTLSIGKHKEDEAFELAKLDSVFNKSKTKKEWLKWAYSIIEKRRLEDNTMPDQYFS